MGVFSDGLNWAYVADRDTTNGTPAGVDEDGLRVIDISTDPTRPGITGNWTDLALGNVSRVFVSGDYAFLSADKLYIIDVSVKSTPNYIGEYPLAAPRGAYAEGRYVYAVNATSFVILDISIPASPILVYYSPLGDGQAVTGAGGYAYIADGSGGLKIYDISTPGNASLQGSYIQDPAYDIEILGDYAFLAGDTSGVVMLDVSDPQNPVRQAQIALSRVVNRISVGYDAETRFYYVYTLNGEWELDVLTLNEFSVVRIR
jgi:hypothetical protein